MAYIICSRYQIGQYLGNTAEHPTETDSLLEQRGHEIGITWLATSYW